MTAHAGAAKCKNLIADFELAYVPPDRLNFPGEL
jgi:hypothetical protein